MGSNIIVPPKHKEHEKEDHLLSVFFVKRCWRVAL